MVDTRLGKGVVDGRIGDRVVAMTIGKVMVVVVTGLTVEEGTTEGNTGRKEGAGVTPCEGVGVALEGLTVVRGVVGKPGTGTMRAGT